MYKYMKKYLTNHLEENNLVLTEMELAAMIGLFTEKINQSDSFAFDMMKAKCSDRVLSSWLQLRYKELVGRTMFDTASSLVSNSNRVIVIDNKLIEQWKKW